MPYFQGTPEARLARTDSKDPATTCKGITASGRPCRRSLAASAQSTPSKSPRNKSGVIAILPDTDVDDFNLVAAAFFCFQHKDQAQTLDDGARQNRTKVVDLDRKTSIDSLANRLGILDVRDAREDRHNAEVSGNGHKVVRRDTLPPKWQKMPGSIMAIPKEAPAIPLPSSTPRPSQSRPFRQPNLFLSLLGCVKISESYDPHPARRRHGYDYYTANGSRVSRKPVHQLAMAAVRDAAAPVAVQSPSPEMQQRSTADRQQRKSLLRPELERDPSSQTQQLLSLIPPTLTPQTTSLLLSELSKPLSAYDRNTIGWIYMYWITPEDVPAPNADAAASLLLSSPASSQRRSSDVIRTFVDRDVGSGNASAQKMILLKIGRATNVQRRLNQWSRQCGYHLSLVRYYPHQPSSSPLAIPRKAPLVQRIERLIHLELSEQRVKRACQGCGREHREWFEVDASRQAVKAVDEVVQRWVAWAEKKAGSME